jgi:cytochrome c oxidase subunit 2
MRNLTGAAMAEGVEGAKTTMRVQRFLIAAALAAATLFPMAAMAGMGQPSPWPLGFQQSATPIMDTVTWFHDFLLYIITAITLFVLALLLIVIFKFNSRANPVPSKTTHNTLIEVAWTVIPVIILVVIAVPSFRLLFAQLTIPPADITIKATGKQWFWTYDYPDNGFSFDSLMVQDKDLKAGQPRLLTVDNEVVVPVNKTVRVQVIGADVIHAFAVPSFGIKVDAVPGRLNETWFKSTVEGVFHGQCSELCGKDHAYMPITVRVVNDRDYAAWLDQAKKKFAANPNDNGIAVAAKDAPSAQ